MFKEPKGTGGRAGGIDGRPGKNISGNKRSHTACAFTAKKEPVTSREEVPYNKGPLQQGEIDVTHSQLKGINKEARNS